MKLLTIITAALAMAAPPQAVTHPQPAAAVVRDSARAAVAKPFGVGELLARIRVALRHSSQPTAGTDPVIEVGPLRMDFAEHRVTVGGRDVRLTRTEYKLLATLVRHSGKVLTHRQLLTEVWGINAIAQTHYLRVYMAQLRHKIERDPTRPSLLLTEPGVGYRLHAER